MENSVLTQNQAKVFHSVFIYVFILFWNPRYTHTHKSEIYARRNFNLLAELAVSMFELVEKSAVLSRRLWVLEQSRREWPLDPPPRRAYNID